MILQITWQGTTPIQITHQGTNTMSKDSDTSSPLDSASHEELLSNLSMILGNAPEIETKSQFTDRHRTPWSATSGEQRLLLGLLSQTMVDWYYYFHNKESRLAKAKAWDIPDWVDEPTDGDVDRRDVSKLKAGEIQVAISFDMIAIGLKIPVEVFRSGFKRWMENPTQPKRTSQF